MNPHLSRCIAGARHFDGLALAALLWAASWPSSAHEGHDHADATPPVAMTERQPRVEAHTHDYELLGIVEKANNGANLRIYLDRQADNSPIDAAEIVVEVAPDRSIPAQADGDSFVAALGPLTAASRIPLVFAISEGERHDLMGGVLEIPAPGEAVAAAGEAAQPARVWIPVAGVAAILAWVIARMRATRRTS
ncbi:MAG: hypothetical protein JNM98_16465 [Rhodocyclaceae bacterium]|nr:hypothetical protein [Rhodocyclaceae bacterium]